VSGRWALAVLGDPLAYTRSPDLHRAGLAALGLEGTSEALPTPVHRLGARLRELATRGLCGVNLTHPLKEPALELVAKVSEPARRARSINTIGFAADGWWGDTTDGPGFLDWLASLGRDPAAERALMLGGGGAARSLALALGDAGGRTVVSARRPAAITSTWSEIPNARLVEWRSYAESEALEDATVVINATPLAGAQAPLSVDHIPASTLVVDLVYGPSPTAWVLEARVRGRQAWDGLGLLVHQARRSLMLWTGQDVPVEPLAQAVGWPR
jgi:shikimate dehydrogenase